MDSRVIFISRSVFKISLQVNSSPSFFSNSRYTRRSVHGANKSSGIKSVIVYKVTGTKEEVIYLDTTYHQFASPDTHSYFDVYYDINQTEDVVDYYLIITKDFAGNQTKKKLTSQRTLLTMFRTSIDRGAY